MRQPPGEEIRVSAPEVLSFQQAFGPTVAFLDEFRDAVLVRRSRLQRLYIDLKPIKTLSVPVAIVLAAEFHRWKLMRNVGLRVRESHLWAPTVRNLLSDLGVFELLDIKPVTDEIGEDNFTLARLMSGQTTDGEKIAMVQERFRSVLDGFTNNPEMFAGLMEAAENAIAHAYPADYVPRHAFAGHRWWAAGCLDMKRAALRFFVFDQGAGIPHTLPSATFYEHVRARISSAFGDMFPNDSVMLKAALEVGRTRTGEDHRGLGLQRMSEVVTGSPDGYLRILSGRGEIVYHADETIEARDHDRSIGGTLIEWNVSADVFRSQEDHDEDH
ncbi:MAG: hypothetical protein ACT6T2_10910 [Shinella sp.]|uniref:hypothetical protein n=1 Tax=Shinella sp. TaxID=1870904 RepID=UPI0040363DA9